MNKDYLLKIANDLHFNLTKQEVEDILSFYKEQEEKLNNLKDLKIENKATFHPHNLYEATFREDTDTESDLNKELFRNTEYFLMDEIEIPKVVK